MNWKGGISKTIDYCKNKNKEYRIKNKTFEEIKEIFGLK